MDAIAISRAGLQTSMAQFTASAGQTVRAFAPAAPTGAAQGSSGALASGDNFAEGLVGQMMALASYRANARVLAAADKMAKATIDLIG